MTQPVTLTKPYNPVPPGSQGFGGTPGEKLLKDYKTFREQGMSVEGAINDALDKSPLIKRQDEFSRKILCWFKEVHKIIELAREAGHDVNNINDARAALNPPKEKPKKEPDSQPTSKVGLRTEGGADLTAAFGRYITSKSASEHLTDTIKPEIAAAAKIQIPKAAVAGPEGLITLTPNDPSNKMTGFTSEFKGIKTGSIYKVKQIVRNVRFGSDRVDVINFTGRLKAIRPDGDQLPIFDFDLVLDSHDPKTIRLSGGKIEIVEEKILTAGQIEDKNRQLPPKLSSAVESRKWSRPPARRERERINPDRALAHEVYGGRTHSSPSGFGKVINEGTDQEKIEITEADLRNLRQSKVWDRFYERVRSDAKIVVNHQGDYENLKYLCLEGNPSMICFEGRGQTLRFEVQHNLDTVSVYPNVKPLRVGETIEIECTPGDETNQYNLARLACSLGTRDLFKFEDGDRIIENAEISSLREVFSHDAENLTSARGCPIFGIFTPDEVIRGVQHHTLDTSTIGRVSVTCVKSENSASSSTPGKKITLRHGENPEGKLKKGQFYKCDHSQYGFKGNKLVDWFEEKDRESVWYHLHFEADTPGFVFTIPITNELTLEEIPEPKPAQQDPVQQANPLVNVGDIE